MNHCEIDTSSWQTLASNRFSWKKAAQKGCKIFEDKCINYAKLKRSVRKGDKENVAELPIDINTWTCEHCGCVLLSKSGHTAHVKLHFSAKISLTDRAIPPAPDETTCPIC